MGSGSEGEPTWFRLRFHKTGRARFLSHRDLMRTFERALRRAGLPMLFTAGYHPRPRFLIRPAVALGFPACFVALDLPLAAAWPLSRVARSLAESLPEGLAVARVQRAKGRRCAPMARVEWVFPPSPGVPRPPARPDAARELPEGTWIVETPGGALRVVLPVRDGREPPGVKRVARALGGDEAARFETGAFLAGVAFTDEV